ncbi:MAG: M64 family metallopeptidase [Thermoanaerobaculia bacterium]
MVLLAALASPSRAAFDDDFTGSSMRMDLYHSGHAELELVSLAAVRVEGPWPGRRHQLLDPTDLGKYRFEVRDAETARVLFSQGYASIYGEWETTGPAADGIVGTWPECLRFPEPRRPVEVVLSKRGADQAFHEIWRTTVDPASRFVDRSSVAPHEVRTLVDSGDPATKVDLLVLGDGYTAGEMEKFYSDAGRATGYLFAEEPFASRRGDFNVRAIGTPARESGISRPRSGLFRDSPLGTTYNVFDSERYVLSTDEFAWRDVAAAAPYDVVLILVNSRKYGGGGIYGLYSTAAIDSAFAGYLVVHEFAHHFAALGDEYYTSSVAYQEDDEEPAEPWEPNLTALKDPEHLKWSHLVRSQTPIPTPWHKEEYEAASREIQQRRQELRAAGAPEEELEALFRSEQELFTEMLGTQEWSGRVGAFEGAGYRAHGLYRPATDCVMFTRDAVGYCPVCAEAITRIIDLHTRSER